MNVTVLEHPLSPYAQKVKLALHYKAVPYRVEQPMTSSDPTAFFAASPRGEVPVLIHDDRSLYDSAVIGAYLEETWPEPALLPEDPATRAAVRLVESAMDTHFEANTWGLGEVHVFARVAGAAADRLASYAAAQIRDWYRWLEGQLSADGWFGGTRYGWGDMCVWPFVNGAARFNLVPEEGSKLAGWFVRVSARDDVQSVAAAAQAAELDPAQMQAALRAGFRREYRDHRLEWMIRAGGLQVVADGLDAGNIRFNEAFP